MDPGNTGMEVFSCRSGDLDWWQTGIVYQIYPRSFQDSNQDGIGDLKGIQSRLDHLEYLGVDIIWLSPIYPSPMVDFGYDVSDFTDIEPIFGTLKDFDDLVEALHSKGMKILMDYIPNHTSDQHRWFQASRRREDPYTNYYIWNDGKVLPDGTRVPPNNWVSVFGGVAWTWDDEREQYYLHQYDPKQPDLNWRNPKVKKDMQDVLEFWLDRGVDGFRIDAIGNLIEAEHLKDEPVSGADLSPNKYGNLKHVYTYAQPETLDVVREWRNMCDKYEKQHNKQHILLVTEMYDWDLTDALKFYHAGADMPFNFNLTLIRRNTSARDIAGLVHKWLNRMPEAKWPNWVLGNHDQHRIASKKGSHYVDALNALLLLLPGTPTTYQGEEIGMSNIHLTYQETKDPEGINAGPDKYLEVSRDLCRSPMQWDASRHSGFSTGKTTWLPVHENYREVNAQVQMKTETSRSHVQLYRVLSTLRRENAFRRGAMRVLAASDDIYAFSRHHPDYPGHYVVLLNLGAQESCVPLEESGNQRGQVVFATPDVDLQIGKQINLQDVLLKPGDALVLKIT